MTPHQMAKRECANLLPDGSCLGVRAEDLGRHAGPLTPLAACALAEKRPCDYFEKCVLPLAASKPEYVSAAQAYLLLTQAQATSGTLAAASAMRACGACGQPVPKRRRFCDACKRTRRKDNTRQHVRSHRERKRADM